ncbi:hypothetical protein JCGZ_12852 [Jatropha curcas]|uniref:Disease resistance protein RPM1-like n=1 Tax=Jatropha curcas TaxID=180498 RepID=A0A067KAZ8_JATCU|nr:hypothetical protein JCGZ_12852 [Jatropha curcas]
MSQTISNEAIRKVRGQMAEGGVTFLLDKLSSLLHDEIKPLRGVREELDYIRCELERIQAFLRAADVIESSNPVLKNKWFRQLRDVIYDIEDILDKFTIQLRHDHENKFYSPLHKIISYLKDIKVRHQFISEVRDIKSRISIVFERYQSFDQRNSTLARGAADNTCFTYRGDALLLEESELVGVDKHKSQLIGWLVKDGPRLKVVSVVGMGGLGKTTIIKRVYDDGEVKKHFDSRAWINVSQSFKIDEMLKDMIYQLFDGVNKQAPQGMETMNSHRLKITIKEFLQQSRYLLVLDDIWGRDAWDAIKHAFPNNNQGSRVLLTTRNAEVASATCIESKGNIYVLEPLSDKESWTLFCKKTFRQNLSPPHLEVLSRQIVQRCSGLPLAIVAMSGILATKDWSRIDEWEKLASNLWAEIGGTDIQQSMAKILLLGYNDLPYYLKSCFLYLSIFPEDHSIECMRLIHLWIAEGFVKKVAGKTLEEVAEAYLNELLTRSLIQVAQTTSDGRIHSCRIHGLVREIILLKSRDQNLMTVTSEQNDMWPERIRCLSIHNTMKHAKVGNSLTKLRSLLIFGVEDSLSATSMPLLFSGDLKLLTVLDLRGTLLEVVPDGLFKMIHLRYLSLRDTKVKSLPSSIGKLRNLETLDLKRTGVAELPPEISKLQQLRHLLVYRYETEPYMPYHYLNGFKAPLRIGELQSLQKLCFVESNDSNGILGELARLQQLKRLGITKLKKEDGEALCSSIETLRNLRSLNVHSVEEEEIIDMQYLSSPPKFLQRLYLHGRLEELPSWISSLHSLVKLYLRWSHLRDGLCESLGDLPNLVELQLRQAFKGQTLSFKAGTFQKLKILFLDELEELRWLEMEKGAMPILGELTISRSQFLEEVPSGIQHLKDLKTIKFFDMPDELNKMIMAKRQDTDSWNLSHVPQIYFIKWKKSCWERTILSIGSASNKTASK